MDTDSASSKVERDDPATITEIMTLLGPKFKFPKSGVIRPGIMVPKSSCSASDVELYKTLAAQGKTWDEIEAKLGTDGGGRAKLIPKNVDYFSVFPGDCVNPENAHKLMQLYADGDGKLRSFPVVFPMNEWWNIVPHSLICYGSAGLKYKSDFKLIKDKNGQGLDAESICTFPLDLKPGIKVFGGRAWAERPCDPATCVEYQSGECAFRGAVQFYIPGISGAGLWMLPTSSWYSLVDIKSSLELVSRITGGRLSGTFGGKSIFRIRKVNEEVSRIDPKTGKSVKTSQWLIKLEADVDMTALAARYESGNLLSAGFAASNMLAPSNVPSVAEKREPVEEGAPVDSEKPVEPDMNNADLNGNRTGKVEPTVTFGTASVPDTVSEDKDGEKKLSSTAELLWKSLAVVCKSKTEIKERLHKLCGADSFYALTNEQARQALNKLTEQMLNRY